MIARLVDLLLRLSGRERGLLAVLLGGVIPAALIFGVLIPLEGARARAQQEVSTARALRDWVAARDAEFARMAPVAPGASVPAAAIGVAGIDASLRESGLRKAVTRLAKRPDGAVDLAFDAVDFQRLGRWLDQAAPGWGYVVDSFQIARGDTPGLVSAELVLRAP